MPKRTGTAGRLSRRKRKSTLVHSSTGWMTRRFCAGLLRIIRKAGLKPWPKLFQNLPATRQPEQSLLFQDTKDTERHLIYDRYACGDPVSVIAHDAGLTVAQVYVIMAERPKDFERARMDERAFTIIVYPRRDIRHFLYKI